MDNQSKHTQGTWLAVKNRNDELNYDIVSSHNFVAMTHEANADLIAAAPELLKELESILDNHRTDGASDSRGQVALSRAREAHIEHLIAKAKG